jgi:hypothetical protein
LRGDKRKHPYGLLNKKLLSADIKREGEKIYEKIYENSKKDDYPVIDVCVRFVGNDVHHYYL